MTLEDESVVLSISELAKLLQTSKSALRYYEKEGLVKPERSSSSGYRRYSFQSIIELSDIVLYRSLGIPVRDIKRLFDSPVEETSRELDKAERELLHQMRDIMQALENIAARRRRLQAYHLTRLARPQFVVRPEIEQLFQFPIESVNAMRAYLRDPEQVRYAVFFPDAEQSATFVDCSVTPVPGLEGKLVWEAPASAGRWLTCLMCTDYSLTSKNDLSVHIDYLRSQGFAPGRAIAEYLTFAWDEGRNKRSDYYRLWIEALDS